MSIEYWAKCFIHTTPLILFLIWCCHDLHSIEEEAKVQSAKSLAQKSLGWYTSGLDFNPGQCGLATMLYSLLGLAQLEQWYFI